MQIYHPDVQKEENPVSKYVQRLMSNPSWSIVVDYIDNSEYDLWKFSHLIMIDEFKLIDFEVNDIYFSKLIFDLRYEKSSEKNFF